jgi:hypothetical protein
LGTNVSQSKAVGGDDGAGGAESLGCEREKGEEGKRERRKKCHMPIKLGSVTSTDLIQLSRAV